LAGYSPAIATGDVHRQRAAETIGHLKELQAALR
jgi:hypothetical protein